MGFGKDGRGIIKYFGTAPLAVGALVALDVTNSTAMDLSGADVDMYRVLKADVFVSWTGHTSGQGPILIGLSDKALTAAQVEEALEALPHDRTDIVAHEQALRPVWPLCIVGHETQGLVNNGMAIEWKPRWTFTAGINTWAYNLDTATLTSGTLVTTFGKAFGVNIDA